MYPVAERQSSDVVVVRRIPDFRTNVRALLQGLSAFR